MKIKKIFWILPLVLITMILGYCVPVKTVIVEGCPGADYTERHNLILGDTLPHPEYFAGVPECIPTVKHVLYLL
jgi:hypothetical protein